MLVELMPYRGPDGLIRALLKENLDAYESSGETGIGSQNSQS